MELINPGNILLHFWKLNDVFDKSGRGSWAFADMWILTMWHDWVMMYSGVRWRKVRLVCNLVTTTSPEGKWVFPDLIVKNSCALVASVLLNESESSANGSCSQHMLKGAALTLGINLQHFQFVLQKGNNGNPLATNSIPRSFWKNTQTSTSVRFSK